MSKFESWYYQQPETTKAHIDRTPVWRDRDMVFAFVAGVALGVFVGVIW
jgi:hypothetical protein